MSNVNRIILIGTVMANPDTKFGMDSSTSMSRFTLSVERPPRQDGAVDVDTIPVVAWGKSADYTAEYVKAQSVVVVEGRINNRTFDNNGQKNWVTEVSATRVKLVSGSVAPVSAAAVAAPSMAVNPFEATQNFTEDDVPF